MIRFAMLCLPFLTVALAASAAPAGRVEISRKDALLDFAYSWPREAAAIPQLDQKPVIVEQEGGPDPLASAKRNLAHIRSIAPR